MAAIRRPHCRPWYLSSAIWWLVAEKSTCLDSLIHFYFNGRSKVVMKTHHCFYNKLKIYSTQKNALVSFHGFKELAQKQELCCCGDVFF